MGRIVFRGAILFSLFFVVFICSAASSSRDDLRKVRPLVWLNDQFMLVGLDNKIYKYDAVDHKVVGVISEPYYSSEIYECFSPEGGIFAISEPVVTKNGDATSTFYGDIVYRWIQDWNEPSRYTELKDVAWWNTNPLDCAHFDYVETDLRADSTHNGAGQLMRTVDGDARVYFRFKVTRGFEKTVVISKDGSVKELSLGNSKRSVGIESVFDRRLQQYFWYTSTSDFDIADHVWPLQAWWVTPGGEVLREITVPAGPWVRRFSTLYLFKYFSCGPSCYSNMKMYAGNGQIYIYIFGDAVENSVQGVYRLDAEGQKWNKIVSGTITNGLVISPNGCQVSYSANGKMQMLNVCKAELPTL